MGVVSLSATATEASVAIHLFQSQQQSSPPPPPLLRGVFPATRGSEGGGGGGAFSISTRTQICFPQRRQRRLLSFRLKSVESSSTVDELRNFRVVSSNVLKTEKEQVKAVLTMFLKKEIGLGNEAAAATISNSVPFIDHLVARLHSIHKTRYLVGRELTTPEIRDALIPYLEYLCEEHEDSLDDVVENFRNTSEEELLQHIFEEDLPLDSTKLKAMVRMIEMGTDGQHHPNTLYLVEMGFDMNQIKQMACRFPSIIYPSWDRKVGHFVEFLVELGVPPSDIPKILYRAPTLCNLSLSENIIPYMAYFESLGLDKSKWAKVMCRCPNLLTFSRRKVEATVDYLYELGLSRDRIGKVLAIYPDIVGLNVDNVRVKAEYFGSMGVNLTSLLISNPTIFNRSIECQLKPVTKFLLDKGFSIDEIGSMASRYGIIYGLSLTKNLIPKWDFFLTMHYPRSELVKFPNYFGYSLEGRIKPRYALMRECDVKMAVSRFLAPSDSDFLKILNTMKMKKMLEAQHDSIHVTFDEDGK